jgi:hypothetical protein
MRGRQPKEMEAALTWLKIKLTKGSVSSKEARTIAPVGWRTMRKAKKALGLVSAKTPNGWLWVYPNTKPIVQVVDEPEEEDTIRMNTESMIACANSMFLDNKSLSEIILELTLSCSQWPMPKPYPRAYIESVARHVFENTEIASHLNQNKDE